MQSEKRHTAGSIKVSEEVIIKIAETAACETSGVAAKGQKLETSSPISMLRGPVRVRVSSDTAAIKMDVIVRDGFNAVSVAENIQKSVKSAVQNMTGFTVTKVDVTIAGVKFSDDEEDTENKDN